MTKVAFACASLETLRRRLESRVRDGMVPIVTRFRPKRADELVDGGSLYWVIRGQVMCRQKLSDVRPYVDKAGISRCQLVLEPKVVVVEPRPWRAFQGWRYLAVKDAPRDLDRAAPGAKNMPETLRRELRELGLL